MVKEEAITQNYAHIMDLSQEPSLDSSLNMSSVSNDSNCNNTVSI